MDIFPLTRSDCLARHKAPGGPSSAGRALGVRRQECNWAGPVQNIFIEWSQLPAEWCPQGQVPAGPCGQMFTEIVGTNLSTHIPTHPTSTPRGPSALGLCWPLTLNGDNPQLVSWSKNERRGASVKIERIKDIRLLLSCPYVTHSFCL